MNWIQSFELPQPNKHFINKKGKLSVTKTVPVEENIQNIKRVSKIRYLHSKEKIK